LWVSELQLASFRNYQTLQTRFSEGRNLIHGPNGEGKTNLVEAIGYLSSLTSHRLGNQKSLIMDSSSSAQLSAKVKSGDREISVGVEINSGQSNKYYLNGSPRQRATDILGNLAAWSLLLRTWTLLGEIPETEGVSLTKPRPCLGRG